ncbi:LysR family transcriptional regulator [Hoeflea sp. BAL378]|uniref:LysR family transcriptional regulator n=1 Tax=Hoeflea sp. BAL378 TaxID=1547437 RepID=UPI000691140D|nr:LysR family transcriptional regulator [Hoeflea sp. BAL378]
MFELKQLKCFVAVATEMNFHRAAARLNMTQPPLSRQIRLLEHAIGVELFDRSGRQIRLTPGGERFLLEARDLLRRAEDSALVARAVASGLQGAVTLGFVPIATLDLLPRIVPFLSREFPQTRLVLQEMLTVHQVQALTSGRHDLGIIRIPPSREDLEFRLIRSERYLLAMHADHPLAGSESVSLSDLNGRDLIMYSPGAGWYGYERLNALFSDQGIRPNIVQYFGETLTMLSLVNVDVGLALVAASARALGLTNVVYREIDLPSHVRSEYYLAYSPVRIGDPVVRRVYDQIIDLFSGQESGDAL